jgi:hypothetical protein
VCAAVAYWPVPLTQKNAPVRDETRLTETCLLYSYSLVTFQFILCSYKFS